MRNLLRHNEDTHSEDMKMRSDNEEICSVRRDNEELEETNEDLRKKILFVKQEMNDAGIETEKLQDRCLALSKHYENLKNAFHELLFDGAHERCKLFPRILAKREECSSSDYTFGEVIESHVGRSVVAAERHWDGEQAVVKMWKKRSIRSVRQMKRIHDEMITLKKLQHRNIVPSIDVWETPDYLNVAYERFGKDLYHTLERYNEKMPDSLIRQVMTPLIDALSFMHSHDIAHCDIKPENIMVTTNGDESRLAVKLADFELAVEISDDYALPKGPRGSEGFMAPEMFSQRTYNPMKCDVWSLGCVLLELLLHGEFEDRWLTHYQRALAGNSNDQVDDFIEDLRFEIEIISKEIKDWPFQDLLVSMLHISPHQRSSAAELVPHDETVIKAITHGTRLPPAPVRKNPILRYRIDEPTDESDDSDDDIISQFDDKRSPVCASGRRCVDF